MYSITSDEYNTYCTWTVRNTTCSEQMAYSAIETTCFGLYWPSSDFYNIEEESINAVKSVRGFYSIYRLLFNIVETWRWPVKAETCSFNCRIYHLFWKSCVSDYILLLLVTRTTGMSHIKVRGQFESDGRKRRKNFKQSRKHLEASVTLSIWNIDLANTQRLYEVEKLFHSQNLILDISREIPECGQGKRWST